MTALKTRQPTGKVPYPFILIEGEEKAGKSWKGAEFSASEKIGRFLWLDLGEGAGDEYLAIPGAKYELIEHDGSYRSIYEQVCAAHAEAARAAAAGEPPVVLWFDNGTQLWDLLKSWIDSRARKRKSNEAKLKADPDAEIDITSDLWNDATDRWRAVLTKMMTFPGIAVMVARGKETIAMDGNGRPIPKQKDYRVEGQKNLAFDASVWLRMTREDGSFLVGARSVHAGVRPAKGARPKPLPDDWSLEHLVFDVLKCQPGEAHVRDLKPTGAAVEAKSDSELARAKTKVWEFAQKLGWNAVQLGADYSKTHDGSQLGDASVVQLGEYAAELLQELEARHKKDAPEEAAS